MRVYSKLHTGWEHWNHRSILPVDVTAPCRSRARHLKTAFSWSPRWGRFFSADAPMHARQRGRPRTRNSSARSCPDFVGESANATAKALNKRGLPSPRGGKWTTIDHQRLRSARKPGTHQPHNHNPVDVGDNEYDRRHIHGSRSITSRPRAIWNYSGWSREAGVF